MPKPEADRVTSQATRVWLLWLGHLACWVSCAASWLSREHGSTEDIALHSGCSTEDPVPPRMPLRYPASQRMSLCILAQLKTLLCYPALLWMSFHFPAPLRMSHCIVVHLRTSLCYLSIFEDLALLPYPAEDVQVVIHTQWLYNTILMKCLLCIIPTNAIVSHFTSQFSSCVLMTPVVYK